MGKLQFMHESCLYGAFCALLKVVMIVFGQKNTSLRVHLIWICLLLLCCSGSVYAFVYWSVSQPPLMLVGHNFNWDFYCGLTPKCQFGAAAVNFRHFLRQHTVTLWRSHIDCRWIWIGGWWHAWLSGPSTMLYANVHHQSTRCSRLPTLPNKNTFYRIGHAQYVCIRILYAILYIDHFVSIAIRS